MKKLSKRSRLQVHLFITFFCIALTILLVPALAVPNQAWAPTKVQNCDPPGNITKTGSGSGSISFSWDSLDGAVDFKLRYVFNGQASSLISVSGNTYTFSGLSTGDHTFEFYTNCGNGNTSGIIIMDEIIH
ncbi:MAG: hypothetical protein AAFZ15_13720 [Bacteroidota bacterium]